MEVKFFRAFPPPSPETAHFILWLATWYGFPDITHFEVDNCRMSANFNLIELNFVGHIPP